jgi:hypothetical protein
LSRGTQGLSLFEQKVLSESRGELF